MESNPDTAAASREELLAAAATAKANPKMTVVPAPELAPGKTILVRQLDGPSGEALERSHFEKDESGIFRYQTQGQVVRWVLACACDQQGNRLFAPSDQAAVSDLPFSLLDRMFTEAKKLNEPDLETVAKNS